MRCLMMTVNDGLRLKDNITFLLNSQEQIAPARSFLNHNLGSFGCFIQKRTSCVLRGYVKTGFRLKRDDTFVVIFQEPFGTQDSIFNCWIENKNFHVPRKTSAKKLFKFQQKIEIWRWFVFFAIFIKPNNICIVNFVTVYATLKHFVVLSYFRSVLKWDPFAKYLVGTHLIFFRPCSEMDILFKHFILFLFISRVKIKTSFLILHY